MRPGSDKIAIARAKGVSAYVGDGQNRWAAAHVLDVARLYRLTLEKGAPGARYHAVAEEGVPLKEIAIAIGRGLNVPVTSISQQQSFATAGSTGAFSVSPLFTAMGMDIWRRYREWPRDSSGIRRRRSAWLTSETLHARSSLL